MDSHPVEADGNQTDLAMVDSMDDPGGDLDNDDLASNDREHTEPIWQYYTASVPLMSLPLFRNGYSTAEQARITSRDFPGLDSHDHYETLHGKLDSVSKQIEALQNLRTQLLRQESDLQPLSHQTGPQSEPRIPSSFQQMLSERQAPYAPGPSASGQHSLRRGLPAASGVVEAHGDYLGRHGDVHGSLELATPSSLGEGLMMPPAALTRKRKHPASANGSSGGSNPIFDPADFLAGAYDSGNSDGNGAGEQSNRSKKKRGPPRLSRERPQSVSEHDWNALLEGKSDANQDAYKLRMVNSAAIRDRGQLTRRSCERCKNFGKICQVYKIGERVKLRVKGCADCVWHGQKCECKSMTGEELGDPL